LKSRSFPDFCAKLVLISGGLWFRRAEKRIDIINRINLQPADLRHQPVVDASCPKCFNPLLNTPRVKKQIVKTIIGLVPRKPALKSLPRSEDKREAVTGDHVLASRRLSINLAFWCKAFLPTILSGFQINSLAFDETRLCYV
jgi:hypothetical protein